MPDPVDHGWTVVEGKLKPLRYEGSILPQALVDATADLVDDADENDKESDVDITTYDRAQQGSRDFDYDSDED